MTSSPPPGNDALEELLDTVCPICLETLKEPVVKLPCDHTYCLSCLEGWRSKYGTKDNRTCPQCRKKIPPTREMVGQYKTLLLNTKIMRQLSLQRPYDIPTLPGDPDYDQYSARYQSMPVEVKQDIRAMSPMEQQVAIGMWYEAELHACERHLDDMRDQLGDDLDAILEDPTSNQVEELPWEITDAAESNDVETVLRWLGDPPIAPQKLNAKNPNKMDRTLLAEAIYEEYVAFASMLLQYGADVDPRNCFGTTPLRQACTMALEKSIRLLLEWGADKDLKEPVTPEEYVLKCGNKPLAQLLASPLGGRRCEMFGLKSRTDLNGKACVTNRYVADLDRYEVKVERTGEEVRVKSTNLKRRDRTPTDCGVYYEFLGLNDYGECQWRVVTSLTEAEAAEMKSMEEQK